MRIKEFERLCGFRPRFSYYGLDYIFGSRFGKRLQNTELLDMVERLVELAYPDEENPDVGERRWYSFYLPVRMGKAAAVRVAIVNYREVYALIPQNFPPVEVSPGDEEVEEEYFEAVEEMIKFSRCIMQNPQLLRRCLPPEVRTGRILGKYVLERVLSGEEKEKLLREYREFVKNHRKPIYPVSLEEYLNVCAVCYRAAYGEKTREMTPEEMYRRWADGRDCGMLEIKDRKSKRAFAEWLKTRAHCGGHPFEIVFSWHRHGIHLYPPAEHKPWFRIAVTNYAYARDYLEMVRALIKSRIPFEAINFEEVLSFLAGETYFRVNEYAEHYVFYHEVKDVRRHIEWDEIRMPRWKAGTKKE